MKTPLRLLFVGRAAVLLCAAPNFASAQLSVVQSPGPPPPSRAPAYDLQQLPETRGTVQRFTLTPRGDLDGFVLTDGTQVHLPPHLSAQLVAAVKAGDAVIVRGYRSPSAPLVAVAAVTDTATGQTVIDTGPPPPGFGPPPPPPPGVPVPGAQAASVEGKVQTPLYGPAGDLNGVILEDGTIIRLPPPAAYQVASLLAPGQTIAVQGWEVNTAFGSVVDAQAIGASPTQMMPVAPPSPPGVAYPPGPPPPARP